MFLPLLFLPLKSQCSHSATAAVTAAANGDATRAGGGSWWPRSVSQPRPAVRVMGKSHKRDTVRELIQLNSLWVPAAPGAVSCHPSWPGLLPATKTRGKAPAASFPGVTLRLVGQQVWGRALLLHLLCKDNQKVQSACNPSTNRPCWCATTALFTLSKALQENHFSSLHFWDPGAKEANRSPRGCCLQTQSCCPQHGHLSALGCVSLLLCVFQGLFYRDFLPSASRQPCGWCLLSVF